MRIRTQVGIVGAGPAGLMLAHMLRQQGIDSVVLELRSRSYAEGRVRAGVLEQGTVDLIDGLGLGARMHRQGLVHDGIELGFRRQRHRIDMHQLTGRNVTVYGQHEVVKDLIEAAVEQGMSLHFEVERLSVEGIATEKPIIRCEREQVPLEVECDFIAGCDGFHGVCRPSIPEGILKTYERVYPFSWLGILAEAKPSQEELVYMNSERGFALFSMRSPTITRLYLQCANDEDLAHWPDARIWEELALRLDCDDGWQPNEGRILQKGITAMRSYVTAPMQYGRLYLAGDAAHIVPPTGAKGMNLAISDVYFLAQALDSFCNRGSDADLENYSARCLRRIWKVQRFSWWMTSMLHQFSASSRFDQQVQLAELDYVTSSQTAAQSLAENYVGLPFE